MADELEPLDPEPLDLAEDPREDYQHRKAEIMRMKRVGMTYVDIGRHLGISKQRVHQIYKQTLEEIPAEEVQLRRAEQAARYDALLVKANEVLERRHITVSNGRVVQLPDKEGNLVPLEDDGPILDAIKTILAIENARAELFGTKTPVKQEISVDGGVRYEVVGVPPEALR